MRKILFVVLFLLSITSSFACQNDLRNTMYGWTENYSIKLGGSWTLPPQIKKQIRDCLCNTKMLKGKSDYWFMTNLMVNEELTDEWMATSEFQNCFIKK